MKTSKLLCTLLAPIAFAGAVSVQAAPMLRLFDGTTTVNVSDGGPGDMSPVAGVVTFIGAVGNWFSNVTTGFSDSPTPFLDLNSFDAFTTGASGPQLDLFLTDTSFTFGPGAFPLAEFLGKIGGTTAGMVTYWLYIDDGNNPFAMTNLIGSGTSSSSPFADSFSGVANVNGTFSMTLQVRINHANAGTSPSVTSFDFEGSGRVAEPATILLLGVGLLGLGFVRRRTA